MDFYGQRTDMVDSNESKLYEFDRVYVVVHGEKVPATVVNSGDIYHPEFNILVDKAYWKNDAHPEIVKLSNGNCVRIKEGERGYRFSRTLREFKDFCHRYANAQ